MAAGWPLPAGSTVGPPLAQAGQQLVAAGWPLSAGSTVGPPLAQGGQQPRAGALSAACWGFLPGLPTWVTSPGGSMLGGVPHPLLLHRVAASVFGEPCTSGVDLFIAALQAKAAEPSHGGRLPSGLGCCCPCLAWPHVACMCCCCCCCGCCCLLASCQTAPPCSRVPGSGGRGCLCWCWHRCNWCC